MNRQTLTRFVYTGPRLYFDQAMGSRVGAGPVLAAHQDSSGEAHQDAHGRGEEASPLRPRLRVGSQEAQQQARPKEEQVAGAAHVFGGCSPVLMTSRHDTMYCEMCGPSLSAFYVVRILSTAIY